MFNLMAIAGNSYHRYTTYVARKQALQVLVRQSDATLRDIGVSRELLSGGLAAWPWQSSDMISTSRPSKAVLAKPALTNPVQTKTALVNRDQANKELTNEEEVNPAKKHLSTKPKSTRANGTLPDGTKMTTIGKAYHMVVGRARAIRELRQLSDRELRDIGITRGSIIDAVENGRPGIERPVAAAPVVAMPDHTDLKTVALDIQPGYNDGVASVIDTEITPADTAQAA